MSPLELAVWVVGALGLIGVALAFFKSDQLRVRLGALGIFGVFYLTVLALGWGGAQWFNASTIALLLIALMSGIKNPLAPKTSDASASAEPDATSDDAAPAAPDRDVTDRHDVDQLGEKEPDSEPTS